MMTDTDSVGQTPSSLERYLVLYVSNVINCIGQTNMQRFAICHNNS